MPDQHVMRRTSNSRYKNANSFFSLKLLNRGKYTNIRRARSEFKWDYVLADLLHAYTKNIQQDKEKAAYGWGRRSHVGGQKAHQTIYFNYAQSQFQEP